MKKVILFIFILMCLSCGAVTIATAAEIPDWDTVDWEQYDWGAHPDGTSERTALIQWLYNEASLEELFSVTRYCTSASFYELDVILNSRFIAEPERFLIVFDQYLGNLDAEKERVRSCVLYALFSEVVLLDHGATVNAIEGCRLSRTEHPGAVELLEELIRFGEERLNITIDNPKTGDMLVAVIGLSLASCLGTVFLVCRKVGE